jgi:6,7-dimethyl-8-ribityllumazine synthase
LKPANTKGQLSAAGLHIAVVVSQFNNFITDRLLAGALDAMERAGATDSQIEIVRVPGALELPIAAKKLAETRRFDSIICVGCVLRGETSHYDVVVSETARGVQLAQLDTGVPLIFCVLTCDTLEQAINRAGLKSGNKGYEAGLGAIEMGQLMRKIGGTVKSATVLGTASAARPAVASAPAIPDAAPTVVPAARVAKPVEVRRGVERRARRR